MRAEEALQASCEDEGAPGLELAMHLCVGPDLCESGLGLLDDDSWSWAYLWLMGFRLKKVK